MPGYRPSPTALICGDLNRPERRPAAWNPSSGRGGSPDRLALPVGKRRASGAPAAGKSNRLWPVAKLSKREYEDELARLHVELVTLQQWVVHTGYRVCVLFEGRDAAGKGGVIKRIAEPLNPRVARVVALGTPTDREKTQWYFQRYVAHLPAAGEIVMFDRSWYNRAGVERVMGFCSDEEYWEFLHTVPDFERMLIRSGIHLIKYYFSVSDEEQERRFQSRIDDPTKHWKLSPMDLASRERWIEYSKAKDVMFHYTDIEDSPWWVVNADDKKRARLNCISHLLSQIPYEEIETPDIALPPRAPDRPDHQRPPIDAQRWVPNLYEE